MSKQSKPIKIKLDNKVLHLKKGLTILQAAEQNNIYIPTLCAHSEMTPFGGCRMCIVEVEGMRGFPAACTTPVEDGMIIRTHTSQIQSIRMEILKLILSEHTSSCLICEEKDECRDSMQTIQKAGVITGCRYCPNDTQCELQDVAEYLGIKEIGYPVYYRHLPVEKMDPFYDRDYNLCILCGRCIRMCQEIRPANTLAFKNRGTTTTIGPAFNRTHLESGCEFCGACVSVCPTGALSEKARKWEGKPERTKRTTCVLCGIGCQMQLLIKDKRVIGSLPVDDSLVSDMQLCVKGRFCITELVNNDKRLKKPYIIKENTKLELDWDKAIESAASKLSACQPEEFGMLISTSCSNEDLYIAQKFTRAVMGSHNINTSARMVYGSGFNGYMDLMKMSVPLSIVKKSPVILCIGLDTRYGRSVVGVELRKAIKNGAKIITIHSRDHNITSIADEWIQPALGEETESLNNLVKLIKKYKKGSLHHNSEDNLSRIAKMLTEASSCIILIGSEFLQFSNSQHILKTIGECAKILEAGVIPLAPQSNLFGSILMGCYSELLPGGRSATETDDLKLIRERWDTDIPNLSSPWHIEASQKRSKLKVLYLIGEVPPGSKFQSDYIISQNIYSPDSTVHIDLVLPSASFTEIDGTFINCEGRVQRVRKAVNPPGEALPDWKILCRIARKMGKKGFNYRNVGDIQKEISTLIEGTNGFKWSGRHANPLKCNGKFRSVKVKSSIREKKEKRRPLTLSASAAEHHYRSIMLSTWVEGAKGLFDEVVEINPNDAKRYKIENGDRVELFNDEIKKIIPARITDEQPKGSLHMTLCHGDHLELNPCSVRIRKKNVSIN